MELSIHSGEKRYHETAAISLLAKGLGFVPTPDVDVLQARLDGRRLTNKLINKAYFAEKSENDATDNSDMMNAVIPKKLRTPNYFQTNLRTSDADTNLATQIINTKLNSLPKEVKTKGQSKNLSSLHQNGLKWIKKEIDSNNISVTVADKGGAVLLVKPELLESKVQQKIEDTNLYEKLPGDPRQSQYDTLIEIWRVGQVNKFVSEDECSKIVGLTKNGNKSTSSRFKPGESYFVPSLKIHKVNPEDLTPTKANDIPARLISSLQDSTTKRSDVFLAEKWLQQLQADYCKDLVESTDETLKWLDDLNKSDSFKNKRNVRAFTFDFEALYDSITPELAIQALKSAITECRPDWSETFVEWLCYLLRFSMDSAVGVFKDSWYKPKKGMPTGGSCSVPLANISMFCSKKRIISESKQNEKHHIYETFH